MTVAQLKKMSQAQLDDLFRQKPPGPVPDGEAKGTALVLPGTAITNIIADIIRIKIWKGKVFERDAKNPNRGVLKNKILLIGHQAIEADVYKEKSWFDGKECIVLDYSKRSFIAKKIRDEIREIEPGLYLGIVYWGKKRTIGFVLEFPKVRA
jgi:hypothetical protein